MKKRKRAITVFLPFIITGCLYLVFYSRIESKPNHVGFWFVLALGMSFGVVLTRLYQWINENKRQ
jgi:uncharacterized membrane protein YedE/YeeE